MFQLFDQLIRSKGFYAPGILSSKNLFFNEMEKAKQM